MTLKSCHKWDDSSSSIEAYTEDISIWMNSNMLKLNKDKTEFIVFTSKQHVKETENLRARVGSRYIYYSMSVRNLGLILDNTLVMAKQVNNICMFYYYQIRNIGLFRKYIKDETYRKLVKAIIVSKLDCNNDWYIIFPSL